VTYPHEQHTATLARWVNFYGLTLSPDGKGLVWSANGSACDKWEAWNNQTRAYISSGAFSGALPAYGSQQSFALTNDHYLYQIAGAIPGGHLVRHATYGAGAQEDMGALTGLTFTASDGCSKAMLAADGKTYIGITSYSFESDGMLFCHDTPSTPPVLLDTSVGTSQDWQIKWFILDGHGDVWALGGRGDLASDELAFWRVVNASGISRTDYFVATMPAAQTGTITTVWGFHSLSGDHFIIAWEFASGGDLTVTVGYDGAVTNSTTAIVVDPHNGPATAANQRPSDLTFWLGHADADAKQYACADLSLIQTVHPDLWGYGDVGVIQSGWTWDPENNALFVGLENGNQNFAWLFFPVRKRAMVRSTIGPRKARSHGHVISPPTPPTPPASVVTKNLLTAWGTQVTAGNTSTPTKNPVANKTELTGLGWGVDNVLKQVFFTADGAVSDFDFTNYECFVRNNPILGFTNSRWAYGTSTGLRLINFDSGSTGWRATFTHCEIDGLGQTGNANGIIAGPALQGGVADWIDTKFHNAQRAYMESGSINNFLRCYSGPVGTWGTLNDGSHCEHFHGSGGTDTFTDCMRDQRYANEVFNPLTGIGFTQGVNALATTNLIRCIDIGIATFAPPLPWGMQGSDAGVGASVYDGNTNASDCCLQRGSSGYCAGGTFTPLRCLNVDTSALIINGNTP
jgi:hypothetical protein